MHRRHDATFSDGVTRTIARSTKDYAAGWRIVMRMEDGTSKTHYGFSRDAELADSSARREAVSHTKGYVEHGGGKPRYKVVEGRSLIEVEVVATVSTPVD